MEESVKRRERLKAMRMEAAHTEVTDTVGTSAAPGYLSNPLIESSASRPVQGDSCATPRFDFYTDPMSAFSANKRRNRTGNEIPQNYFTPPSNSGSPMAQLSPSLSAGPRNAEMAPPPANQGLTNFSPDQRMYPASGPYQSSMPHRTPIVMASPFPLHQGTPPGVWNGSGGTASYRFPSNLSGGSNFPSPGFGRAPSFNSGQGRGHWCGKGHNPGSGRGGSPNPDLGRGWGRMSPGSGHSGGRQLGSHSHYSAQEMPQRFYNKSMVEDPWKFLKPVIWSREDVPVNSLNTPNSSKSWLPKSVSMKKARVSEASSQSNSQFSLAEYLASSFNEAVKDVSSI